ncbi:hypothetical protein B5V00_02290 [Geothermobacter hydrogeniphilus]|uniref:Secretin/TonB short N-terminal domain-containing protein n=2 Tax=Geothermobacter hydrogeniphilus TaxID=1969733 RepID=A0A1X0YCQ5_9BACT|nr:hypothetical protein B5V00_02290 [Geothermobacter hydrogeniphilus]
MRFCMKQTWKQLALWGSLLLLLTGCAAQKAFESGEELVRQARYDEAVLKYSEALRENPDSQEYRMKLFDARSRAALDHLNKARKYRNEQQYQQAVSEYLQASSLDPSLETADQEMRRVQEILHADELVSEAEEFYKQRRFNQAANSIDQALLLVPDHARAMQLQAKIRRVGLTLIDGVELDVTSTQPITLKFKNAKVKDVFKILSKLSGINFIFDEDVERQQVTVFLEDATFAQALELLLKMNKLEKRVLNPKTVILYPKTKEKEKQYQDLIIQTFYLSNIDAKKAVNMLRTMLQLRKIYVNEQLNALVIRDKPQVIKLAEQILKAADRAEAEVVFDLELVGVSKTDLEKIGVSLSAYSAGLGFSKKDSGKIVDSTLGSSTDNLVSGLSNLETFYTLPSATFDFAKSLTSAEVLANPKLRVKNKEKAKIHVGTREPIITVTTSDNNTRSDNIQYVDVGVKLNVEPDIQLDNTVVTKLDLEVSSVIGEFTTESGTRALTIQTTTAQTAITLKDGERTILGGLLEDRSSKQKDTIPWLGDIPFLGSLVSGHDNSVQKREILLSITPHIVKNLDLPKADVSSIWSGSEDTFQVGPSFQAFAKDFDAQQKLPRPQNVPAVIPHEAMPAMELKLGDQGISPQARELLEDKAPETDKSVPAGTPARNEVPSAPSTPADEAPGEAGAAVPQAVPQAVPTDEKGPVDSVPQLSIPIPDVVSRAYFQGPKLIDAGQEFTLTVRVDGVEDLYSAPMFVSFDHQLLQFVRATEGSFLRSGGTATVFTTSPNQARGQIIVGYKQGAGGQGVSGDGVLYQLVFRALKPGTAKVNLQRINFRDPAGNRLKVTAEGTLVEVR